MPDDLPKHLDERSAWSLRARKMVSVKLKFMGRHIKWAGSRVLVMQCESGLIADGLVRRGCEVSAIDTRANMLEYAKSRSGFHGYRVDYARVNAGAALPFEPESFDIIICDHVFDRNWDVPSLANTLRGLLTPKGTLMYSCVNATVTARWAVRLGPVRFAPGLPLGIKPLRPLRPKILNEQLFQAGFEPKRPGTLSAAGNVSRLTPNQRSAVGPTAIWLGSATRD